LQACKISLLSKLNKTGHSSRQAVPAAKEAETEGSLEPRRLKPAWTTQARPHLNQSVNPLINTEMNRFYIDNYYYYRSPTITLKRLDNPKIQREDN
jgi:hypothetical protein